MYTHTHKQTDYPLQVNHKALKNMCPPQLSRVLVEMSAEPVNRKVPQKHALAATQ